MSSVDSGKHATPNKLGHGMAFVVCVMESEGSTAWQLNPYREKKKIWSPGQQI